MSQHRTSTSLAVDRALTQITSDINQKLRAAGVTGNGLLEKDEIDAVVHEALDTVGSVTMTEHENDAIHGTVTLAQDIIVKYIQSQGVPKEKLPDRDEVVRIILGNVFGVSLVTHYDKYYVGCSVEEWKPDGS